MPFNCCLSVVCNLIKGITPKIRKLCFVLINSVLLKLLCVWILFQNVSSHSCFRKKKSVGFGHKCNNTQEQRLCVLVVSGAVTMIVDMPVGLPVRNQVKANRGRLSYVPLSQHLGLPDCKPCTCSLCSEAKPTWAELFLFLP